MPYIYILTNKSNTLYVGVTNDLNRRMAEHKSPLIPGFTSKYNLDRLVYYEEFPNVTDAITIEKKNQRVDKKKENRIN